MNSVGDWPFLIGIKQSDRWKGLIPRLCKAGWLVTSRSIHIDDRAAHRFKRSASQAFTVASRLLIYHPVCAHFSKLMRADTPPLQEGNTLSDLAAVFHGFRLVNRGHRPPLQ